MAQRSWDANCSIKEGTVSADDQGDEVLLQNEVPKEQERSMISNRWNREREPLLSDQETRGDGGDDCRPSELPWKQRGQLLAYWREALVTNAAWSMEENQSWWMWLIRRRRNEDCHTGKLSSRLALTEHQEVIGDCSKEGRDAGDCRRRKTMMMTKEMMRTEEKGGGLSV